jgi:hypothetical protein
MAEVNLAGYTIKFPEDWQIKELPSDERERTIIVKNDEPYIQAVVFISELGLPRDPTVLDVKWMNMLGRDITINEYIEETQAEYWMKNIEVSMETASMIQTHHDLTINGRPGFDLFVFNNTTKYAAYRIGYWLKDVGKETLNIWEDFDYTYYTRIITVIKDLANNIHVTSS